MGSSSSRDSSLTRKDGEDIRSVLEDAVVKSNHLYFNEMFDSTSNQFNILDKLAPEPLDGDSKVDLDKDVEFVGLEEDKGPINMEGINCGTLTYEKNKGYDIAMHGNYLHAQPPLISCNRLAPNFLDGRVQNSWELSMISNKSNWTSNGELKLRADKEKLKIMHKDNDGDMHGNDGDMHGNDLQLTHHPNLLKEGPVGLDPLLGPQRPTSAPSLSHDHFSFSGSILHGPAPQPTSPSSGQPMMEASSPSALGSMGPIASGHPLFGLPLNQAHSSGSSINGQQHLRLYEMDKKDGPHSIQAQHQSKGEDGLDPSSTSSIRSPGPLVDGHMQGERGHVDLHSQMEIHSKEHRPVGINPDNISKIGKIHKVVKKFDKKFGNDKFSMTTRSNAKAGKLVHNFLTKGGGSRGLNNSSSHSGNH
ncbi:hypothetical protein DH2020_047676 [Rehmannia glutinosa]|uniref:Uncharacterized protein n=1 Tax=Rehmannia glutinosa TaxID=99300 RepID=A0ABR0U7Z3_REHGL